VIWDALRPIAVEAPEDETHKLGRFEGRSLSHMGGQKEQEKMQGFAKLRQIGKDLVWERADERDGGSSLHCILETPKIYKIVTSTG